MSDEFDADEFAKMEIRGGRDYARTAAEKADCCMDKARFVAEIPRKRNMPGDSNVSPARFRLCAHHAALLRRRDPAAGVFPIGRSSNGTKPGAVQ